MIQEPQTLQELRKFFEDIPEEFWIIGRISELGTHRCCAVGHMVMAFGSKGRARIEGKVDPEHRMLGLMHANDNDSDGPKTGTLFFIDKLIRHYEQQRTDVI